MCKTPILCHIVGAIVLVLLAGALCLGAVTGAAATIAKVLLLFFFLLFVGSLFRGKKPAISTKNDVPPPV
jgi:uncharacterized membrane protein YtjA (UPF0391 family)